MLEWVWKVIPSDHLYIIKYSITILHTFPGISFQQFFLRKWMPKLHTKLTKAHRRKLAANSAALKVATKKKKADGTTSV